ncbi:MAG: GTP-binding protein [Candidatus Lokiarchaeota archaeon]|nr:GTP-binding protein [Candidatus Lokiarchaeota archaeon]
MLREIYIIRESKVLYWISYGSALSWESLSPMLNSYMELVNSSVEDKMYQSTIVNFKVSYIFEKKYRVLFLFISDITDDDKLIEIQLKRARSEFVELFGDEIISAESPDLFKSFTPISDLIHRELRPKIALCGFSGVGKTTTTKLIKADEIPTEHIPTMTGEISTIKIGKLHFYLWDFAGQEQFSFLWPKFIKGSDAVILITDSTLNNIDKSKFFINLVKKEVPTARFAVVANKQDLPNALSTSEIAKMLGVERAYGMVAVDPKNRAKMISVIADVLKISQQVSPLIKPLIDRDKIIEEAQIALEAGNIKKAADNFESIAKYSMDLGEDKMAQEFFERARTIRNAIVDSREDKFDTDSNIFKEEIPLKSEIKTEGNKISEDVTEKEVISEPVTKSYVSEEKIEQTTNSKNIEEFSDAKITLKEKIVGETIENSTIPQINEIIEPQSSTEISEDSSLSSSESLSTIKDQKPSSQVIDKVENVELSEKEQVEIEINELFVTLKNIEKQSEELDADLKLNNISEKSFKEKKIELLEKESSIRKKITELKIKLIQF